jgi:hypothetical protein
MGKGKSGHDGDRINPALGPPHADTNVAEAQKPRDFYHPYSLPRPFGRSKLEAEASDEEIAVAERSLYGWWWRLLKASPEYPAKEGSSSNPRIADVYRDFGELGDNFSDWWRGIGRRLFADTLGKAVHVWVVEQGFDHDDMPRRMFLDIYMHVSRKEILREFNAILDLYHPGSDLRPERYSLAKRRLYENAKYRTDALPKLLEVWRIKQQHPDWKWYQIGESAKVSPNLIVRRGDDKSRIAEKHRDLNSQTRALYKKAERLLYHAVRGEFPRDDKSGAS